MNKKTKLILSGLGATIGIAIIPVTVVACSSTVAKITTKDTSNLTDKGFLLNIIPLNLTIKDMPLEGLPNQNGQSTVGELSKYISITNSLTGVSLVDSTIVSQISFTNGDATSAAKISFSLGVEGSFSIVANQNGVVNKDTTYNWTFYFPNFSTGKDLSKYLDGLQNTGLDSKNVVLTPANASGSYNPNGIQQYIWFKSLSINNEVETFGVLIGTWSTTNKSWEWTYNINQSEQISPNVELSASGIPSNVITLDELAKWIDFLPELNQYSISKDAVVNVSLVNADSQTITISGPNNNVTISGKFANGLWTYTYVNRQTIHAQMQKYINLVNQLKFSASSSASSILPSQVNEDNISQYVQNIPKPPFGTTITYKLVPDNSLGKLLIVVNILANGQSTLSSVAKEVSGFLTTQQEIQNYINNLNNIELKATAAAAEQLPSFVTSDNISQFIANIPKSPEGATLSYNFVAKNITGDLQLTISISAPGATTVVAKEQIISGFLTQAQKEINDYVIELNKATIVANEEGKKVLPSSTTISAQNIESLISALPNKPTLTGFAISFKNIETNAVTGQVSFVIAVSGDNVIAKDTNTLNATGFLTNQQAVDNYIAAFDSATISANTEGVKLLATDTTGITTENLSSLIDGMPLINITGITLVFNISSRQDGSLNFTITASLNGATKTSAEKTATGFLTNQQAVDNYINEFNGATFSANTEGVKLLATDTTGITNDNLSTLINGVPPISIEGMSLAFTIVTREDGRIIFTVSASLNGATKTSAEKTATGFLTNQQAVDNYIAAFDSATISANTEGAKLLATDTTSVTNENLSTLINGMPLINITGITLAFNISSRQDGSLSFTVSASLNGVTKNSSEKTATGFLTNQQALDNYINEFNGATFSANAAGAKLLATDTTSVTNENLSTLINGIPPINTQGLTLSCNITAREQDGSLSFTVTASLNGVTKTSESKTATGFLSILNIVKNLNLIPNGSFAAPQNTATYVSFANSESIFANYNMTGEQVKTLSSVENLYMEVANSSLTEGTAILKLFLKVGASYLSAGQIDYSGFFKGTAQAAQTSIQDYLKNNDHVASWLNTYLSINPTWLDKFINLNANDGNFFWGYRAQDSTVSNMVFNDISVTNVNNVITIKAISPKSFNFLGFEQSTNDFTQQVDIPANSQVTIQLPLSFQTDNTSIVPLSINTNANGQTTLSWSGLSASVSGGQLAGDASNVYNITYSRGDGNVLQVPFRIKNSVSFTFQNIVF